MKYLDLHCNHVFDPTEKFAITPISEKLNNSFFSSGVHPWIAEEINETDIQNVINSWSSEQVALIGEIGLDHFYKESWEKQISVFTKQINEIKKIDKPLLIHSVKTYEICNQYLKKINSPIIFHNYNGNKQITKELQKRENIYFSFGQNLTKNNSASFQQLPHIANNKFFLESDEIDNLPMIYEIACKLKNISVNELLNLQANNWQNLFKGNEKLLHGLAQFLHS